MATHIFSILLTQGMRLLFFFFAKSHTPNGRINPEWGPKRLLTTIDVFPKFSTRESPLFLAISFCKPKTKEHTWLRILPHFHRTTFLVQSKANVEKDTIYSYHEMKWRTQTINKASSPFPNNLPYPLERPLHSFFIVFYSSSTEWETY